MKLIRVLTVVTCGLVVFSSVSEAGKKKSEPAPAVELSEAGKKLEAKYADMQAALKAELAAAIPKVPTEKQTPFLKALVGLNDYLSDEYNKRKDQNFFWFIFPYPFR